MEQLTYLLLIICVLIPANLWIQKIKQNRLSKTAAQIGFEFVAKTKFPNELRKLKFTTLRGGINLKAKNLLHKQFKEYELSIFEFKSPHMGDRTLFLFKSEKIFPDFNLYPLANKLDMPLMEYKNIEFKSTINLTKSFCLKGIDPKETRAVFTDAAIEELEEIKNIFIEVRGQYFLIFRSDIDLTLESVNMFLPDAKKTFETFKA